MPTRYYLRAAVAPNPTGLPTAEQSADTAHGTQTSSPPGVGSRSEMSTGAPDTGLATVYGMDLSSGSGTRLGVQNAWWFGPALPAMTIAGGTITFYFAKVSGAGATIKVRPFVYVYRPSVGKVGDLYASGGAGITDAADSTGSPNTAYKKSFSYSGLAVQAGDRVVIEFWFEFSGGTPSPGDPTIMVGGPNTTYVNGATVANDIASYIEFTETFHPGTDAPASVPADFTTSDIPKSGALGALSALLGVPLHFTPADIPKSGALGYGAASFANPMPAGSATLNVASTPSGMAVTLDSLPIGSTPLTTPITGGGIRNLALTTNAAAPVIANFSPAPGTNLYPTTPVSFDITDDEGLFSIILLLVKYPDGSYEVAYDGSVFSQQYAMSTSNNIVNGAHFVLRRTDGWPGSPTVVPVPVDHLGNVGT